VVRARCASDDGASLSMTFSRATKALLVNSSEAPDKLYFDGQTEMNGTVPLVTRFLDDDDALRFGVVNTTESRYLFLAKMDEQRMALEVTGAPAFLPANDAPRRQLKCVKQ
jgi:hypothetical protein